VNTKLALRVIGNLEAVIASVAFAIMITVVSANVIIRFATGTSLVFTEEIAYLGFGYSVFFCISWIYRMRGMIAVDLVVDALPPRLQAFANMLCYAILSVANAYFFYLSAKLAAGSWVRKTAFLEIPYFWVNLAPTVSFGLMAIYSVWFLYLLFRHQELPSVELEQQV
jgi:TRAP-type C4-dicarboxylate transport system permease small subunit